MAADIEQQLRSYFDLIETQSGGSLHRDPQDSSPRADRPVTAEAVTDIVALEFRMRDERMRVRQRRRILVAVAAAVALLATAGVLRFTLVHDRTVIVNAPTVPATETEVVVSTVSTETTEATPASSVVVPETTEATPATSVVAPETTETIPATIVVAPEITSPPIAIGAPLFTGHPLAPQTPLPSDYAVLDTAGSSIIAAVGGLVWRTDLSTETARPPTIIGMPGAPSPTGRISPDGNVAFGSGDLFDLHDGTPIARLGRGDVRGDFSPDSTKIVVPATTKAGDTSATIFDTATGKPIRELVPGAGHIGWAIYSPDGSKIMTYGEVGTTRIWDAVTGEQLAMLSDSNSASSFSADGTRVLSVGPSGRIRVRDAVTGDQLGSDLSASGICCAQFTPDGNSVVVTTQGRTLVDPVTVTFYKVDDMSPIVQIAGVSPNHEISASSFSAVGHMVVVLDADGSASIWSLASFTEVANLTPTDASLVSIAFSPDGGRLVGLLSNGDISLWEAP